MDNEKQPFEDLPENGPVEEPAEIPAETPDLTPADTWSVPREEPQEAPVSPTESVPEQVTQQPAEEQPAEEQPAEVQPEEEQPAEVKPAEEQPEEEQPAEPAKKGWRRASGKWTDILPIAVVLSIGLMVLGEVLKGILFAYTPVAAWLGSFSADEGVTTFLSMYFEFIGIWIAFILLITIFRSNWPMWKAFFYNGHGNNIRSILVGILLGGGMNGFCILMSVLQGDIKLSFNAFEPTIFFAFLLCVFIQSGAEEIVDRCYLYQKLRRRYRWPAIAVLVNSLVFAALHLGNPGVTPLGILQVFEIGVLFSLIVYYFDSLWTAIWAHTAWNFSQSIVFGLPNSGIVSAYSVFKLEAASARDGIFYNTGFGVEGSIGANIVIGAAIVIVLIAGLLRGRGERVDLWTRLEERGGREHWEPFWAVIGYGLLIAVGAACGYLFYKLSF